MRTDTLIVIDPTDVRRGYAQKMQCLAVVCEPLKRLVIKMHLRLWSVRFPT
ncbi:MAG TPA: hypothetical protein PLE77_04440 [Kiritimatiellia bacterium]|nr:hypothetical protein [Kiritimatiellia bacterium]